MSWIDQQERDEPTEETEPITLWEWFREFSLAWGLPLLCLMVVRSAVAEPYRIPSGSMIPTLEINDYVLVNRAAYGYSIPLTRIPLTERKLPERGDVIVFVYPESDTWSHPFMPPGEPRQGGKRRLSYWLDIPIPMVSTLEVTSRTSTGTSPSFRSTQDVLKRADIVVGLVAHRQFKHLPRIALEGKMVIDTCGVFL